MRGTSRLQRYLFSASHTIFTARTTRLFSCAALGLAFALTSGCGKDQPDSYPTTDKNGTPLTSPIAAKPTLPDSADKAPLTPDDIAAKADKIKNTPPAQDTPTEAQMGIPFYPGANPSKNKGDLALTTESASAILLTLETSDSVDKVDAFYKGKLPAAHRLAETIAGKLTIGYIDDSDPEHKRSVDLSTSGDKTLISLIAARTPKSEGTPPMK